MLGPLTTLPTFALWSCTFHLTYTSLTWHCLLNTPRNKCLCLSSQNFLGNIIGISPTAGIRDVILQSVAWLSASPHYIKNSPRILKLMVQSYQTLRNTPGSRVHLKTAVREPQPALLTETPPATQYHQDSGFRKL